MSGINSSVANYSGRQPDSTQNIKQFVTTTNGIIYWFYKRINNEVYVTPADPNKTVLIPKDLFVVGSITNTSDVKLKENIEEIPDSKLDHLLNLAPKKYNFISDETKKTHYGLIAQELEVEFPELINVMKHEVKKGDDTIVEDIKTINYIELIPLLLMKMQKMQYEIDDLKHNCCWR
jgi:hypothetical protein